MGTPHSSAFPLPTKELDARQLWELLKFLSAGTDGGNPVNLDFLQVVRDL
jgi:hypothetical protein